MRATLLFATAIAFCPQASSPPAAAPFEVVTELGKAIFHVFQDSKGNHWFGSRGQGLYRHDGSTLVRFTTASGLCDNDVGAIQEDKSGSLFISTSKGICKFDGRNFTTLKVEDFDDSSTERKPGPDALWFMLGGEKPHAIYYDGKALRRLEIPTTAAGDAHYADAPRSKFPNMKYSPYDAYTFYKDSRGNLWFGTATLGACRYDGNTFAWISEKELDFDEKGGRNFGTRSIIEDRDGKFWITVTRHRYDMYPTGSATKSAGGLDYVRSPGLAHPTKGAEEDYTFIMSMAKDTAGDLWMATYGAGVWRYDGKTLTNYPVLVDGKPITVFSIYRDREDGLWLGTHEHGAWKFNGTAFEKFEF